MDILRHVAGMERLQFHRTGRRTTNIHPTHRIISAENNGAARQRVRVGRVTNQDAAIDLTVIDPSGNFSLVAPVVDNSASNTAANFEEFEIKGATGGDEIELGAKPDAGANAVIGGLSFSQTEVAIPEPSTWALIATAALVLGWRLRRQGSIS